ncbi:hypothetical protein BJ165DRAFT_1478717 [Panaeolus papilionaceus]|nr:hypothetical protein BJ165DRAFT_1478717 [Panaeolus papilionaceus]
MASGNSVHRGHVEAIRKLHIKALAPPQREGYDEATEEPDVSFSSSESIMCILPLALQALCNLQTFKWEPQTRDPEHSHEVVARTVSGCTQLTHLEINTTYLTTSVLSHFKNLTFINYVAWGSIESVRVPEHVVDGFAQAVIQSPRLSSFRFETVAGSEHNLDRVIQRCDEACIVLPVKHLILRGCLPPLTLLPHLRKLTSLNILTTPTKVKNAEERRLLFQDLWLGITNEGVQLQHIAVDRVPDALVDYLKSYHGLKTFQLNNHVRTEDDIIENVYLTAERFYDEALTNHFLTLECLDIDLEYEDQWCFHRTYQKIFAQCNNLVNLAIGFGYGQIGGLRTTDPLEAENPCLHLFLDTVVPNCPHLKVLKIRNPLPDRSTASDPYSGHMEHYQIKGMWEITQHKLRTWTAPPNCRRLPKVYLSGYNQQFCYVAPEDSVEGPLKYVRRRRD